MSAGTKTRVKDEGYVLSQTSNARIVGAHAQVSNCQLRKWVTALWSFQLYRTLANRRIQDRNSKMNDSQKPRRAHVFGSLFR
jgi:hypothetical protein